MSSQAFALILSTDSGKSMGSEEENMFMLLGQAKPCCGKRTVRSSLLDRAGAEPPQQKRTNPADRETYNVTTIAIKHLGFAFSDSGMRDD